MNEKQVNDFFKGNSIPKVCKCGNQSFSFEEVEKCIIDFSNGYFERLKT